MKRFLREYFTFSRSEIRVLLILVCLIMVALIIHQLCIPLKREWKAKYGENLREEHVEALASFLDGLEENQKTIRPQTKPSPGDLPAAELKPVMFDPNTAGRALLDSMGLDEFVINNLLKYRAAGGRFTESGDFSRIYGLDSALFVLLKPYIRIKANRPAAEDEDKTSHKPAAKDAGKEVYIIEINSAGEDEFRKVRGIGEVLAERIIRYRDLLGGFVSPGQLKEVYGISDSLVGKNMKHFRADTALIRKLSLKSATFSDLLRHPYLSKEAVKAIMQYRKFAGEKASVPELSGQRVIPDSILRRIGPYLEP